MVLVTRDLASSFGAEQMLGGSFKSTRVPLPNIVNFIFLTFKKYCLDM